MGFFPDEPAERAPVPPPAPRSIPPWMQPPTDEYPVRLPVREFIVRTPETVITVSHVDVHRAGVLIALDTVVRRTGEAEERWQGSWGSVAGRGRPGEPRMGLALGDGTAVLAHSRGRPPRLDEPPAGWSLRPIGGSGGGDSTEYRTSFGLWLWPLPPAGALELVLEMLERGIPETRLTLDADAMLAAVPGVRPMWPE